MVFFVWTYETPLGTQEAIMGVTDDGRILGIPADARNADYRAYLSWIEEGNTPQPFQPPSDEATPKKK